MFPLTAVAWTAIAGAVAFIQFPRAGPARLGLLEARGLVAAGTSQPLARRTSRALGPAGVVGAAAAGWLAGGPLVAVGVAAVAGCALVLTADASSRRRAGARRKQVLAAVRILVAELEVGARPPAALAAAAEVAPDYAPVLAAAAEASARGGDAAHALTAHPDTEVFASPWRLGEQAGIELAGVLSRVALDRAADDDVRRAVGVALAGPRASAAVLTTLPAIGLALGAAMGARPWQFLLLTGPGRAVCCTGLLLDVAGVLWMRAVLRRAEPP